MLTVYADTPRWRCDSRVKHSRTPRAFHSKSRMSQNRAVRVWSSTWPLDWGRMNRCAPRAICPQVARCRAHQRLPNGSADPRLGLNMDGRRCFSWPGTSSNRPRPASHPPAATARPSVAAHQSRLLRCALSPWLTSIRSGSRRTPWLSPRGAASFEQCSGHPDLRRGLCETRRPAPRPKTRDYDMKDKRSKPFAAEFVVNGRRHNRTDRTGSRQPTLDEMAAIAGAISAWLKTAQTSALRRNLGRK